jgi:hypothetical protein
MATVVKRRLVNSAGKGKRKRKRNKTAKQIKFFGTAAEKAALKHKRRNAWLKGHRKRTASKRPASRAARKGNTGDILTFGLASLGNPAHKKRRESMAKTKKKKARRASTSHSGQKSRRANRARPRLYGKHKHHAAAAYNRAAPKHKRHYKHNPGARGVSNLLIQAGWTIAGAVGTRALVQFALGAKNTGVLGYGANAAAALALGYGVGKLMKNPQAGKLVALGGFAGIVLRLVQDYTPFGTMLTSQLQGLGDIGIYGATTYFVPLDVADNTQGNVTSLPGAVIPQAPVVKGRGVAGLGVADGGRYAARGRYS